MKSIALCELEGLFEVMRHGQPERDVVFLGVADEEQGGALGTQWLLQHRPDIFEGLRYALNEGGITETRQEQLSYFGIEIGTKMAVTVRLRARRVTRCAESAWHSSRTSVRAIPTHSPRSARVLSRHRTAARRTSRVARRHRPHGCRRKILAARARVQGIDAERRLPVRDQNRCARSDDGSESLRFPTRSPIAASHGCSRK